ncbi:MAG: hypothetical protein ABIY62_03255 [Ginsengibacter sp.]
MKKFFTLLVCTAIISSAFSQADYYSGNQQDRQVLNHNNNDDPRYERDREVDQLNYQNNFQVQRLVNDPCLSIWEKKDALDALESQRIGKVNIIYQKYNDAVAYFTIRERNNSFNRNYHHSGEFEQK